MCVCLIIYIIYVGNIYNMYVIYIYDICNIYIYICIYICICYNIYICTIYMCVLICMFVICIHVWIRLTRRHEKQKGRNTAVIHNQASLRPSIRQRNIYMSYMYVIYIYICIDIYICIIIYIWYIHSRIQTFRTSTISRFSSKQSVRVSVISRHFHGSRNPTISQDIPAFNFRSPNDVLQTILDLSQVDPDPMQKLSENWAPMEFVTVSPVEKGCWWSFYWKNIMRNIYIVVIIYIWYTYMKKKGRSAPHHLHFWPVQVTPPDPRQSNWTRRACGRPPPRSVPCRAARRPGWSDDGRRPRRRDPRAAARRCLGVSMDTGTRGIHGHPGWTSMWVWVNTY